MKYYRPVFYLSSLSKILEEVVASSLNSHISSSNTSIHYPCNISTETALLKIQNGILVSTDDGRVIALVLLDPSAAVDAIDHTILVKRLDDWFGWGYWKGIWHCLNRF